MSHDFDFGYPSLPPDPSEGAWIDEVAEGQVWTSRTDPTLEVKVVAVKYDRGDKKRFMTAVVIRRVGKPADQTVGVRPGEFLLSFTRPSLFARKP